MADLIWRTKTQTSLEFGGNGKIYMFLKLLNSNLTLDFLNLKLRIQYGEAKFKTVFGIL